MQVRIVGAGLAGAFLATSLARRGHAVEVYERRADPRHGAASAGRSINLVLAARGIAALERAGLATAVEHLLMPMRGRCIHEHDGTTVLLPYGQAAHEQIHSVSREALGVALIECAAAAGATLHFGVSCTGADLEADALRLRASDGREFAVPLTPTIATDGAGSPLRAALQASGVAQVRDVALGHGYLELSMPADAAGALDPRALHIWPRETFMLIALPNTDGSFTATLFLPREGAESFASLANATAAREFFVRELPSALPCLPALDAEFASHPRGQLGTVYVQGWHATDQLLLLGDAAHTIVPFHGQGMNCAFEDVAALDALLDGSADWGQVFADFSAARKSPADAIAAMALENYDEMRDDVLDADFRRRKWLGEWLERAFPTRFIPRYSMVMFHAEIPYDVAYARGRVQASIVAELAARYPLGDPELADARQLVESRLTPVRG